MSKLVNEIRTDLNFIRSHQLQPGWYKVLKVFILVGFLVGYWILFGLARTVVFLLSFFFLSLVVHLVYRNKTKAYAQTWLDFVVEPDEPGSRPKRIGIYYYGSILINTIISILVSFLLVN